jgi:hypothetical protein
MFLSSGKCLWVGVEVSGSLIKRSIHSYTSRMSVCWTEAYGDALLILIKGLMVMFRALMVFALGYWLQSSVPPVLPVWSMID